MLNNLKRANDTGLVAVAVEAKRPQSWKESPPEAIGVFAVVFRTDKDEVKGHSLLVPLGSITGRVVRKDGKEEAWDFISRKQLIELNRHKDEIQYKIVGDPAEKVQAIFDILWLQL